MLPAVCVCVCVRWLEFLVYARSVTPVRLLHTHTHTHTTVTDTRRFESRGHHPPSTHSTVGAGAGYGGIPRVYTHTLSRGLTLPFPRQRPATPNFCRRQDLAIRAQCEKRTGSGRSRARQKQDARDTAKSVVSVPFYLLLTTQRCLVCSSGRTGGNWRTWGRVSSRGKPR